MARLWYLNAGFDLELAGEEASPAIRAGLAEMTLWAFGLAKPGDRLCLDQDPPDELLERLRAAGIEPATGVVPGEAAKHLTGEPWGWSPSAKERLADHGASLDHPPLEVVAQVNSRTFGHQLAQESGLGVPGGHLEADPLRLLSAEYSRPLVVKPMNANAGRGLLIRTRSGWRGPARERLDMWSAAGQPVLVEPWLERTEDLATRFDLDRDGRVTLLGHHRTLVGPNGVFSGDLLVPDLGSLAHWRDALDRAMEIAAGALHRAGYFGPVGLDAFTHRDDRGTERLVTAMDINARHPVSSLAYALRARLRPDRPLLLRTISARRHRLPESDQAWADLTAELGWDSDRGLGVLLLSPLRVSRGERHLQPRRSLICIQAESRSTLQDLYSKLLDRLGRGLDDRLP